MVESELDPLTFTKRKDADCFKRMLKTSTRKLDSDIVKREVTEDGLHVTYGDGR